MYFDTLKDILADKTVWVVAEIGNWYCVAVEVCFSKAEAEAYISSHSPSTHYHHYAIYEHSVKEVLATFDERTKNQTIRNESKSIAERADRDLRIEIEREVEKKYDEKLKPIRDTLDALIRRGV